MMRNLTKIKLDDGDLIVIHYHYNLSDTAHNLCRVLKTWLSSGVINAQVELYGDSGGEPDRLQVMIFSTKGIDQIFEEEVLR